MESELPIFELLRKVCKERAEFDEETTITRTAMEHAVKKTQSTVQGELTPLYVVSKKRLFHVVELLLSRYNSDPWARESKKRSQPVDLIGKLSDEEA